MHVVVDTNVIVSGLRRGASPPALILGLWSIGLLEILSSAATLAELTRVLNYPKIRQLTGFTDSQVQAFLQEFQAESVAVDVQFTVNAVGNDPADNHILALAVAGGADYTITGDSKHLLPLKEFQGIPIVSPAAFLTLLQDTGAT